MKEDKKKGAKVPNLRFPGFEGEWETLTLKECVYSLDYGMNAAAKDYDGQNKYIRITDIDEASSKYIDNPVSPTGELHDKYLVEENDMLFARTGASTGKAYLYDRQDGKMYFAGFLIRAKVRHDYNAMFVFAQTQTSNYHKWVKQMSMRSGQPGINSQEYASLEFACPSKSEQDKIASFLTLIDERISTQSKIIQRLESLMKTLNNRMICRKGNSDPELRFSDFSEEWEHTTIKNILQIGSGRDYKHLNEGDSPVFGTGGYMASVDNYLYDGQTVFIGRKGTINKPFFFEGRFWTVDTLFYTHSFCNVLPRFCFYIFNAINWLEYNEASGVPSLSKTTIESIDISIPSLPEQEKITTLLSLVDDKIKIEKSIIRGYQKQKKHLLAQLFI